MTDLLLVTEVVVIVNVALVLPAATVTLEGSLADDELSLNDTTAPPLGAGPLNVTVPLEVDPPLRLVGFKVIELSVAGVTFRVAVLVIPP